jgi:pimeloyl-ACP methyl ester carboxylesterase
VPVLAEKFHVVALDLPGFGDSPAGNGTRRYGLPDPMTFGNS